VARTAPGGRGALICAAASLAGCVTSMYPGPRRPDNETMLVETDGTSIVRIDDVDTPGGSKFRLLPGRHHLELTLSDDKMGGLRVSVISLPVCFVGRAGHAYLARPAYYGRIWRPRIIDENVTYPIASDDCSPPKRDVSAPVATRQTIAAPATPNGSAEADGAAPTAAAESTGAEPVALQTAAASEEKAKAAPAPAEAPAIPAPRAPVPSVDREAPRGTAATAPRAFQPTYDISAELGFFQGGEELVTATSNTGSSETLGAGDGLLVGLGARVTPLWLADTVGLGVGGGAGFKVWQIGSANGSSGNSSIFKWVLTATGHVMFSVQPTWLLVLQGGIERDSGIDWSVNGSSTGVPFRSRTGFVGDLGLQHALSDNLSLAGSFRFTLLDYDVGDQSVGANSFGATFSVHYGL